MTVRFKKIARIIGFVVGCALVVAAVVTIARSTPTISQLGAIVTRPDALLIGAGIVATLGTLIGASGLFYALVHDFGRITRVEMIRLIAASSVLNYLPMRPGLLGRIVHQEVVNGIPMRKSVVSIVEAAFICALTILWLAIAIWTIRLTGNRALAALIAAVPILGGLAFVMPDSWHWRRYLEAIFWRWLDLISWSVRYAVVFAVLDVDLNPENAATAACIAGVANMIPFLGNGLGIREWAIGLAGPARAIWPENAGLAAELLNRALDIAIVVPIGLCSMPGIARRVRQAGSQPSRKIAS